MSAKAGTSFFDSYHASGLSQLVCVYVCVSVCKGGYFIHKVRLTGEKQNGMNEGRARTEYIFQYVS